MEMPLTPMDFARRARRLYADREAVVDGDLRLKYGQFLERCNRWSSTLQALGVRQGDRVAYIAPNTHAIWRHITPQQAGLESNNPVEFPPGLYELKHGVIQVAQFHETLTRQRPSGRRSKLSTLTSTP